MPNWGLTETQINTRPWGIDPAWLTPAKTITDPVHRDIFLNRLEVAIVDSDPMQRLRGVRQLGTAHLVYPGATHSRFSHCLGTLRAAQDLLDAVVAGLSGPGRGGANLLSQWRTEGQIDPTNPAAGSHYDRYLAEATVLARLGGLLHDLGHIPMGHTIEDDLEALEPHDANVARYDRLWNQLPPTVRAVLGSRLTKELRPLILSKEAGADPDNSDYPFVSDIVGNTICADLMDYIRRDHAATGLPLALGNRFVNGFYVTTEDDRYHSKRMAIRITRNGRVRHDAVTELVKYLRYRYELSERVLYHHTKVAADAMIGKLLDMWRDSLWLAEAEHRGSHLVGTGTVTVSTVREAFTSTGRAAELPQIDNAVTDLVEDLFLSWSDDGLLAYLQRTASEESITGPPVNHSRLEAVVELCSMLRRRDLFKAVGHAGAVDRGNGFEIHAEYKRSERRRDVEEGAAAFAGLKSGWQVVVWVPSPQMRPKQADVIVNYMGTTQKLSQVNGVNADAKTIVDRHADLWQITVLAHPDGQSELRSSAILAWLKEKMGLSFLNVEGKEVPSIGDLLVSTLAEACDVPAAQRVQLHEMMDTDALGASADLGFLQRLHAMDEQRRARGIGAEGPLTDERLTHVGW